jgi:ClpP class serine protease
MATAEVVHVVPTWLASTQYHDGKIIMAEMAQQVRKDFIEFVSKVRNWQPASRITFQDEVITTLQAAESKHSADALHILYFVGKNSTEADLHRGESGRKSTW